MDNFRAIWVRIRSKAWVKTNGAARALLQGWEIVPTLLLKFRPPPRIKTFAVRELFRDVKFFRRDVKFFLREVKFFRRDVNFLFRDVKFFRRDVKFLRRDVKLFLRDAKFFRREDELIRQGGRAVRRGSEHSLRDVEFSLRHPATEFLGYALIASATAETPRGCPQRRRASLDRLR